MEQESIQVNGFPEWLYKESCKYCGKEHIICTQRDDSPEYYTDVYIKCSCGKFVEFNLPVN